jgi:hypothetical protein
VLLPVLRAAEAIGLRQLLPFTVGQLATFRFPGAAADNRLTAVRRSDTGLNAMLSVPHATIVSSETLAEECRVFTRYLVGSQPTTYVVDQYVKAHHVSRKLSPADVFDQRLVAVAARRPLFARLVDSYARIFAPSSLLRQKLVLLLAILETAPPTCHVIDRPPAVSGIVLVSQLAGKSLLWLISLLVATALLFPARLVLGGRKLQ